jgi:hypothetical protein
MSKAGRGLDPIARQESITAISKWLGLYPPSRTEREKANFTLVEHPERDNRSLAVQQVTPEQRKMVWRWGGYLFVSPADAEEFAKGEMIFGEDGPPTRVKRSPTSA